MGSLQRQEEEERSLVQKICNICSDISKLPSLKPSKEVDTLFTELVGTCIPPSTIEVAKLSKEVQAMRCKLIKLCGTAEGLLESHYSTLLGGFDSPLDHLTLFPYYSNYLKLGLLEYNILLKNCPHLLAAAPRVAFVGSGPLPLTSIVLAKHHMKAATFHNYDVDPLANSLALRLTSADRDLSERMVFHTTNIMEVTTELGDYDVVFLAALVGMERGEKLQVLEHLAKHMAPDAVLMLRSAAGARVFLYPVIDSCDLPEGFETLSVFHPTDEVINSVMVARKQHVPPAVHHHHGHAGGGSGNNNIVLPCKWCSNIKGGFCHGGIMDELVIKEQAS